MASTQPIGGKPLELFMTDNCPFAQRTWIGLLEKEDDPYHPKLFNFRHTNYFNMDLPNTHEFYMVHNTVPCGVLPDGTHLKESNPMVFWADETYPQKNPLGSKDEKVKAAIAKYTSGEFDMVMPMFQVGMAANDEARRPIQERLFRAYAEFNKDLVASGGPFLMGAQFTAADIAVYPFVERARILFPKFANTGLPWGPQYHAFNAWVLACAARPSVAISSADRTDESMRTMPFAQRNRDAYIIETMEPILRGVKEQCRRQLRFAPPGVATLNVQKGIETKQSELAAEARVKEGRGTAADLAQAHVDTMLSNQERWVSLLADNVRWELPYGPACGMPAVVEGKEHIKQFGEKVKASIADFRFHNTRIRALSDNEAVMQTCVLAKKQDGSEFDCEFVFFIRSENGKITSATEYFNTAAMTGKKPSRATVKVGDKLPAGIKLFEDSPDGKVELADLTKGKKVIIVGVPGAFTPGCHKTHLPGYVADAAKFKGKGIDEVICVAVNDPFVMGAWGDSLGARGKVRVLADTNADLARALGVAFDVGVLGGVRSKRYSLLVEDGVVKQVNIEPESAPTGLTCSLSSAIKV